jgi:hypothetical protein
MMEYYPADMGTEFEHLVNTAKTGTCTTLENDIDTWISIPTHVVKLHTVNSILPVELSTRLLSAVALRSYQDCTLKIYMLVNKHGADVNAISSEYTTLGRSVLAIALGNRRDDAALALLDLKADANLPMGPRGEHPLVDVAFKGSAEVLKSMFAHNADFDITNAWGNTVLVAAISAGRLDNVKFLLETVGMDPNKNGGTGLPVTDLLDMGVPLAHDVSYNIRRDRQWSPLHAAVDLKHSSSVEMVRLLLEAGADVNYRCEMPLGWVVSSSGYTPLELLTIYATLPGATNDLLHDTVAMLACQVLLKHAMEKTTTD